MVDDRGDHHFLLSSNVPRTLEGATILRPEIVEKSLVSASVSATKSVEAPKSRYFYGPKEFDAMLKLDPPIFVTEVRGFLGMARHYKKFIKDFAKIAGPLTRLTRKEVKFVWIQECQAVLDGLKKKFTIALVLIISNESGGFVVHTDVSGSHLGFVLMQHVKVEIGP
ncbi:uncharacterized protein LOC109841798 [Asparagus officinalis]|uniref:uncharacterized protein LOC109841798 n=1 Tax=Asparagus officinalis TaxID=4686 RepID=UPI00098DF60A|nr:uncharacterized protein LOC109841798 [Asparagus officinalis]